MSIEKMEPEIRTMNFTALFSYVKERAGDEVIKAILQKVDLGKYQIKGKNSQEYENLRPEHLVKDPDYFISNAFSLLLFETIREFLPGESPFFEAGRHAVRQFPQIKKRLAWVKLVSPNYLFDKAQKENSKYNKTKALHAYAHQSGVKLDVKYLQGLTRYNGAYLTRDVCEWNKGIYYGYIELTGASDINVEEKECTIDGNPCCSFVGTWKAPSTGTRIKNFIVQEWFPDVIENYQGMIEERDASVLHLEDLVTERSEQYRAEKVRAEKALESEQELRAELVRQEVVQTQKDNQLKLEKAMSSGLAHEGRNALMPAAIQIRRLMEYQEKQSAFDILSNKSGSLLQQIINLENEYGLPQEAINQKLIPIFREINDLIKDISKTTEEISTGVGKGLGLIDLFRTYSKTQEMTRGVETIDVLKIANALGETYKKRLSEAGIAYTVKVIDNTEPLITGDYLHIESIIKNLFLNAMDALEKAEKKKIDITISRIVKDVIPYLRITIADTGEGIPADQYEKIFQAFYTTKSAKGTGLGLSIVKRLVEIYEGNITFESQVGRGTIFFIDLRLL